MAVYEFDRFIVLDESNRPAVDAVGQVYSASDTSFTSPLPVTDLAGLALELKVDAFGLAPAFQVEHTEPMVVWKSGTTAAMTLLSVKAVAGTAATATEALETAQTAQTSAATAASSAATAEAAAVALAPDGGAKAVGKGELVLNVKDFGAVGDGTADDTAAVSSAVTSALAAGSTLYWPAGTYLTTSSVADLHEVRHDGSGVLSRSGSAFHVRPRGSDSNTLHVAPGGVATNDGLSPSQPTTFQAAFDFLRNYGPVLDGSWTILAAAGTYAMPTAASLETRSTNRVVVRGPSAGHPNVPTAVVDGTGGAAYAHGLRAGGIGTRVEFRDLKFINFTTGGGDTTRIGCVGENEADVLFANIHATGASWCGVYAFNTVRARVDGGIFTGCRSGVIANDTQCTVLNSLVENSTESGIYWSRGSQGHIDFVTFEDNAVGLLVAEGSRVDTVGDDFKRNTWAIQTQTGGVFGEGGAPNTYNVGTADAQIQGDVRSFALSGDTTELGSATQEIRVATDRVTRTLTGTTAATVMASPYIVPARRMVGAGKELRVHVKGVFTAITANSVMTVGFGGMSLNMTVPGAGTNIAFEIDATLMEVPGGYRAIGRLSQGLNAARLATATSGFAQDATQAIEVRATPANAADSVAIYRSNVYVIG